MKQFCASPGNHDKQADSLKKLESRKEGKDTAVKTLLNLLDRTYGTQGHATAYKTVQDHLKFVKDKADALKARGCASDTVAGDAMAKACYGLAMQWLQIGAASDRVLLGDAIRQLKDKLAGS